ncbi:hypothetical protein F1654_00755 [Alkalicaulis satelles]|uniref:Uncharacterized protein n=1 Tax=Alkalicaulis satelles TaxID=2609175 RepID=A0A5M6ZIB0_9PROT|nr:hypothetical protein [Alkalicaulis satelles]KAA5804572.1 hypothetical protein F1654_00755 [Alkalicaulis satelles]
MTDTPKPLDLEEARAAMTRARQAVAPAAVRAPRPADLSRLQEAEARALKIDARAGAFRDSVRDVLGLGGYAGPVSSPSRRAAHAMSAPLCDADMCAPVRIEPAPARSADLAPPPPSPSQADGPSDAMEAEGPGPDGAADLSSADASAEPGPADIAPDSEPRKTRKKFLGIF